MKKRKKKLMLPVKGRKVGGVAIAMANYFDIDVVLVRIFWVLLFMPGGLSGLIPYVIAWILIPDERDL